LPEKEISNFQRQHPPSRMQAYLNALIDDAVNDTEGVKVEVNSFHGTIGDFLILLMEVIEELQTLGHVRKTRNRKLTAGP
jgi:hypothetical protein